MINPGTKLDNSPGDPAGYETAAEANSRTNELGNLIGVLEEMSETDDEQILRSVDALSSNHLYTATGTADAIILNRHLTDKIAQYITDMVVFFTPTATNTGAVVIKIGGLVDVALESIDGALPADFLSTDYIYLIKYDGTKFIIVGVVNKVDVDGVPIGGSGGGDLSYTGIITITEDGVFDTTVLNLINTTANPITMSLPTPVKNLSVSFKDLLGTFNVNSLTIVPANGEKIELAPKGDSYEISIQSVSRDMLCIEDDLNADGPHWIFV